MRSWLSVHIITREPFCDDNCICIRNTTKTAFRLFAQPFVQVQIKENIKAPRHWPLWAEFAGDRWIPRTKGQ